MENSLYASQPSRRGGSAAEPVNAKSSTFLKILDGRIPPRPPSFAILDPRLFSILANFEPALPARRGGSGAERVKEKNPPNHEKFSPAKVSLSAGGGSSKILHNFSKISSCSMRAQYGAGPCGN